MSANDIQEAAAAAERVEMPADLGGQEQGPAPDDQPCPVPEMDPAPEAEAAEFELNDYGNGRRLVHYFGENLRHVPRLGWFRWDDKRWVADEDGVSVRADAQKIGARILHEIKFIALTKDEMGVLDQWEACKEEFKRLSEIDDPGADDLMRQAELQALRGRAEAIRKQLAQMKRDHRRHANSSGNSGKITNMMAEAEVALRIDVKALNSDPFMVNTRNGVVHFVKCGAERPEDVPSYREPRATWRADLVPHHRHQLITKMIEADYDPGARAVKFHRFFNQVQPDPEIRDFLQRFAGYSLLGITTEQKLLFNYGIGRNGKSTLVDLLADILADYGTTLPIESLTGSAQRKGSEATPDLVRLPGARFVRASEPEQGTKMKEALIKALTGGEAILIRRMHAEFIEIVPEFTLWISGNHKPEIRGADDGIWRRVMLVPWSVQIPDADVDPTLPAELRKERDGILAWMIEGALKYLNTGLPIPAAVREATQDYRTMSDPMREFLVTECEVTGDGADRVTAPHIRDAFNAWRLAQAESTWTSNTISRRMMERSGVIKSPDGVSFEKYKSNGETGWRHLRLKPSALARLKEFEVQIDDVNRRAR